MLTIRRASTTATIGAGFPRLSPGFGLALMTLVLVLGMGVSLSWGAAEIGLDTVLAAFTQFDGSPDHLIVRTVRLPRVLVATTVGAALAVAGAIMQALTRNPLAAPYILGVNAGAALAVVGSAILIGSFPLSILVWFAYVGAAAAAAVVYVLGAGGRGGLTPVKLTLAGAAVTALLMSLTQGLLVLDERTLDEMRFWLAGSVSGRDLNLFLQVAPYLLLGLAAALVLGKQFTVLSLGDDIARSLGQSTGRIKLVAAALVVVLAGGSVAIAGPIAFLGLAVPHVARAMAGSDYRWVLPYSAVLGALLLLTADIGARLIIAPEEVPVGVMTALVGAPLFIKLVRGKVGRV